MEFKSGFVAMIGRPNTGKSTLLNTLTGVKVSIVSSKPQTTRNVIKTVVTKPECQMIFIDTPGIYKPKNKLGNYMVNNSQRTLEEVDVILFLVDVSKISPTYQDKLISEKLKTVKTPVVLILNKIDLISKTDLLLAMDNYSKLADFYKIIPVSALNSDGTEIIFDEIMSKLPVGPKYFPEDTLTCEPEKFIVAEIIREKLLKFLDDEIPHGVGVEVVSFKQRENKDIIDIQVNIYCERKSHKSIIIGKGGEMLKRVGTAARTEIEVLLGTKVFMETWVKVKEDWRNNENMLKMLGYK